MPAPFAGRPPAKTDRPTIIIWAGGVQFLKLEATYAIENVGITEAGFHF
jgi:hypothetical protein